MTFSAHSTEVRAMCQHAIPYCRLFADQVRPWVEFAIWTEQPTWGASLRTFQKDAKIASPIKDKSHKTPESAPAAGDFKPACDNLAVMCKIASFPASFFENHQLLSGEMKVSTSTVAALFSKMALTGQRIAMVDMVFLVFTAFSYLP